MLRPRDRVTLAIEKPAAGGWMIARHEGQVVLVAGAIPGERVVADITRADRSVAYATAIDIVEPDADRRPWPGDWTCGGASYAFISYARQLALKGEVVADAFARIGRLPLDAPVGRHGLRGARISDARAAARAGGAHRVLPGGDARAVRPRVDRTARARDLRGSRPRPAAAQETGSGAGVCHRAGGERADDGTRPALAAPPRPGPQNVRLRAPSRARGA